MNEPIHEIGSAYLDVKAAASDCQSAMDEWGDWHTAKMHLRFAMESLEAAAAKIERHEKAIGGMNR